MMTGELWDFAHTSYLANWVAGAPVVVNSMFANLVEGSLTLLKPRRSGAEGGTRTRKGFPTRPSNVRVYQFHHFGRMGSMKL